MDRLTVIHEAAHAMVVRHLGGTVLNVSVTPGSDGERDWGGYVEHDASLSAEQILAVLLAGYHAELLVGTDEATARYHASDDLDRFEWMLKNCWAPADAVRLRAEAEAQVTRILTATDRWRGNRWSF